MRKVPSAVVVITTKSGNECRGVTCTSFNSISLSPPIISFALKTPSNTLSILTKSNLFAVHILSSKQIAHSKAFSSPKTQSDFQNFPHYILREMPILQGCLGVFICKLEKNITVGDHVIFFGKVESIEDDGIAKRTSKTYERLKPLLYFDSSYR